MAENIATLPNGEPKTDGEVPPAFHLTDRDKQILSLTDEQYHLLTWTDLRDIIARNDLEALTRLPSQLHKYLAWSRDTKAAYGSMTAYLLQERLHWDPLPQTDPTEGPTFAISNIIPFSDQRDYKILRNDWPYGLAPGIMHIVVWLKTRLPVTEDTGDLTAEGRAMVDSFVSTTFTEGLDVKGQDKVMWFKNWTGLQSVRGLEHVHVLVRDVDNATLAKVLQEEK